MTRISQSVDTGFIQNPLDCVEDVLSDNNWVYDRTNNEELLLDVAGSVFSYRLCFVWQENMDALQIVCNYGCRVSDANMPIVADTIMKINSRMWMGHFELSYEEKVPRFRYTCLFHDRNSESVYNNIQGIVDICFAQCERYQSTFQMLASDQIVDNNAISLAMMDIVGES